MIIKNMFSKPIDRDIKGVIKVGQDDDANIKQELEEYVVTRELQKHFSDFFASYKRGIIGNTDKMGVWISGFFGSGKSHFLKILSYLLENKEVGGKKAIDYFVDDNKISDQMVLADMKLAGTIPTDVVLFNIDSKSEVNGKQSKVAIVSVLQNVFNEMQGFSGSNPFLADLERKLTEEGKYNLFKEKFEDSFGSIWEESRSDFDFIQDDVVEVLDEIELSERIIRIDEESKLLRDAIVKVKSFGTDYDAMTEAQQYELGAYVNLMLSATQLLVNPILGLQPKYGNEDFEKFISWKGRKTDKALCNDFKTLIISFANLLYKIDLDDNDKRLLYKTFKGNKKMLSALNMKKKEFKVDILNAVEEALLYSYK